MPDIGEHYLQENELHKEIEEAIDGTEEQPRDESGKFASPEPDEETAREVAQEVAEPPQFESVEEALAALEAERQQRLNLEKKLGEQGSELGELRKLAERFDQFEAKLEQPDEDLDEMIDEDPQQAMIQAWQRNDDRAYAQAYAALHEEDPATANILLARLENARAIQPFQQQQVQDAQQRAVAAVLGRHPDLTEHSEAIAQAAQERPWLKQVLNDPNQPVAVKERALEDLYSLATAGRESGSRPDAAQKAAEDAQRVRDDAAVVSASTAQARGGRTATDAWLERYDKALQDSPKSVLEYISSGG